MAKNDGQAYRPHKWVKGRSKFTADRMNHIEDGVAGAYERVAKLEARLAALEGDGADEQAEA